MNLPYQEAATAWDRAANDWMRNVRSLFGRLLLLAFALGFAFPPALHARDAEPWRAFKAKHAFEHVRILVEEIGPRPAASAAEARALAYVSEELRALGLEVREVEVGWVELMHTPGRAFVGSRQLIATIPPVTGSKPEGQVLLAAHIDTRDRWCPGANDDASAVGVLLEIARVLAEQPLPTEVVLLISTAEELGMLGAAHYVQTEPVDGLRFALSLDPVGYGDIFVAPFPVPPQRWANEWLIDAADRAKVKRVAADPAYLLVPRVTNIGFGADHMPFLERGIPALNLSNRLERWSYHTERDTLDRIEKGSLKAAGRLSLALLSRAASEAPVTDAGGRYLVLPLPGHRWWVLSSVLLLALVWAGISAGVYAAVRAGREAASLRVLTALGWILVLAFALIPERVLETVHDVRFPWWSALGRYLLLGGLAAVVAFLAVRRIGRWLGLAAPASYSNVFVATSAGLCALYALVALAFVGRDLAFYVAWPALLWGAWSWVPVVNPLPLKVRAALHALIFAGGVFPVLTLAKPALYRQAIELLAYGWAVPGWLVAAGFLVVLLPAAMFVAASPGLSGIRVGTRGLLIASVPMAVLFLGLCFVAPYTNDRPQTVLARVLPGTGDTSTELELYSYDRIGTFRVGTTDHHELGTFETLAFADRAGIEIATLEAEPAGEGEVHLRIHLRAEHAARKIGIVLRGEGLSFLEDDPEPSDRLTLLGVADKYGFEWEGKVRGTPGTELRVTPYAEWDYGPISSRGQRDSLVVDAIAVTRRGDAALSVLVP